MRESLVAQASASVFQSPSSMKVYITGTSKGLGKALAVQFLQKGCPVVGIGRNNVISHPNYSFIECDLSDLEAVKNIRFHDDGTGGILINNAGVIGTIKRVSDLETSDLETVMKINTLVPMILSQRFLKDSMDDKESVILNISSGAASRSIPGWAAYCASKSALDRFSETLYLEETEKGRPIRVYSVAPGIIDTQMQQTIRSADQHDFSSLQTFRDLKENDELQSPEIVAKKVLHLLDLPFDGRVIRSLRELDN